MSRPPVKPIFTAPKLELLIAFPPSKQDLLEAAEDSNLDELEKFLLHKDLIVNVTNAKGESPLFLVTKAYLDLLSKKDTVTDFAEKEKRYAVITYKLLEAGANVNGRTADGQTLHSLITASGINPLTNPILSRINYVIVYSNQLLRYNTVEKNPSGLDLMGFLKEIDQRRASQTKAGEQPKEPFLLAMANSSGLTHIAILRQSPEALEHCIERGVANFDSVVNGKTAMKFFTDTFGESPQKGTKAEEILEIIKAEITASSVRIMEAKNPEAKKPATKKENLLEQDFETAMALSSGDFDRTSADKKVTPAKENLDADPSALKFHNPPKKLDKAGDTSTAGPIPAPLAKKPSAVSAQPENLSKGKK